MVMDNAKIEQEAKKIMDDFLVALESSNVELKEETGTEEHLRENFEEGEDKDFEKYFFSNAPKKDGKNILAEKKEW